MKRLKFLILSLILFFIISVVPTSIFAQDKEVSIITIIDTSKISNENLQKYLDEGDFDNLKRINDKSLDFAKKEIENRIGKIDELSRDNFLLPFISFNASKEMVEKIKDLGFIKEIQQDIEYDVDLKPKSLRLFRNARYSSKIIGVDESLWKRYDGRGEVIAIIDANFNPKHEVFKLDSDVTPIITKEDIKKVIKHNPETFKGFTEEDIYVNSKIPLAFHYINKNIELNPEKIINGHGQHVSAIAGGNNGTLAGKYSWRGVSPNSQLLLMNCFANESTLASYYIKAISDAVYLRASAINMSLGKTKGAVKLYTTADKSVAKTIDMAIKVGTNVVIAAGNEGAYEGDISIDNPDFGTIASPGIHQSAITVASIENNEYLAESLTIAGKVIPYQTADRIYFKNGEYNIVDCGSALTDEECKEVSGKVALIKRGGDTFSNKIERAEKAGAKGVIFYNNVVGSFNATLVKSTKLPVISILMSDGEFIKQNITSVANFTGEKEMVKNPTEGEISDFSNWGVTAEGILKPDLTAPGGKIYSANNELGFSEMSGTSMATPHISGAISLLSQSFKSRDEFRYLSTAKKGELVKTILMNSAKPVFDKTNKVPVSPRRQGAGVVDMKDATELDFTVVDSKTNIASVFIDGVKEEIELSLKIKNYSSTAKEITPSVIVTIADRQGKKDLLKPAELFSETYDNQVFTVDGNSEIIKTIKIPLKNLDKLSAFEKGAFVEGFLTLSSKDGKKANFPFVTFKGDFKNLSIIEKPVYEFNFDTENPMFWNLKPTSNAWHRFMTHIESKIGDKNVVLGMKNFDEIDGEKKNQKDTSIKPEFDKKLVISPNGDGKLDDINLYSVFTRTAEARYEILNSKNEVITKQNNKIFLKNISYWADKEDLDESFLGYTNLGQENLNSQEDGEYSLNIIGKPLIEGALEQTHSMKFYIDKTAPKFKDAVLEDENKKLTFNVEESNEVKEVKAVASVKVPDPNFPQYFPYYFKIEEKVLDIEKKDEKQFSVNLPEGVDRKDITVTVIDTGLNEYSEDVDLMTTSEKLGKLKIIASTKDGEKVPVSFDLLDERNNKITNIEKLRKGRYTFVYKFCPIEYKGVNIQDEYEIEITDEKPEAVIELEFEKVKIGQKMVLIRGTGDLFFDDFSVIAVNLETNQKFPVKQEIKGTPQLFLNAPYGKYRLELKFSNKAKELSYDYEFSSTEIEINEDSFKERVDLFFSESKYKAIPITKNYDGHVDYIGLNLSVGAVVDITKVGRGKSEIAPKVIPEGYYVIPGMQIVTLTDKNPVQEVVFEYHKINEEDKFALFIEDNAKEKNINAKYKIFNFNERFNVPEGALELDYTPGMKLSPGWYCVEAQEYGDVRAQANEPSPTFNLREKIVLVDKKGVKEQRIGFTWGKEGEGTLIEKYSRSIEVNLPKDFPRDEVELEIRIKDTDRVILTHIYKASDPSTHSVYVPSGYAYDVTAKNLPFGYEGTKSNIWVYGPGGFGIKIDIKKVEIQGKNVNVKFLSGNTEIPNVKYKLNELEFVTNSITLEPKKYQVEILSPESYKGKNITKQIDVTNATDDIQIQLEDIEKGTLDIKFEYIDTPDRIAKVKVDNQDISITGEALPFKIGKHKVEISDIDNNINNFIIEPNKVIYVDLTKENPDQKIIFKIRRNPATIDISELTNLVSEEKEIVKSKKYLDSLEELQENYKKSIEEGKKLIEDVSLRNEFSVKKAIETIKSARESLDGNQPYAQFVKQLKNLISEKEKIVSSSKFLNADEDLKEEYLDSIDSAENLLKVNFEISELKSALSDIENAKFALGIKLSIKITGVKPDETVIMLINEETGEEIKLEASKNDVNLFEKSVLNGKYKVKITVPEGFEVEENNFEMEIDSNNVIKEVKIREKAKIVVPEKPNDNSTTETGTEDKKGWVKVGEDWKYIKEDKKEAKSEWLKDEGKWYKFDENGKMEKGKWIKEKGKWYYLKVNGSMSSKEWVYENGQWFYANESGRIAENEWIEVSGKWYYAKAGGYIVTNQWHEIGGKWYHFGKDGALSVNTTVDGYRVDKNGEWIKRSIFNIF